MSDLERELLFHIKALKLPMPVPEYQCVPDRKFRFDLAFPEHKVAVEVQGGIWTQGAHARGNGLLRDYEKLNLAQMHGWVVLFVAKEHIASGQAVEWIRDALELRSASVL
jgi:very-short-patch-repair endonuclease